MLNENYIYDDYSDLDEDFFEEKPKRKRGRPKGSKNNPNKPKDIRKGYFFEEQEQAVLDYNATDDAIEKNRIYETYLKQPFITMVESIIRRYKLFVPTESFEENFHDTLSYMLSKLSMFKPEKGRAYSYAQTICKNYLLGKVTSYQRERDRSEIFDDVVTDLEKETDFSYSLDDRNTRQLCNDIIDETVKNIQIHLESPNISPNEKLVGLGLVELLGNLDETFSHVESNKYNRATFLLQLMETTGLDDKTIRKCMKRYKDIYLFSKKSIL